MDEDFGHMLLAILILFILLTLTGFGIGGCSIKNEYENCKIENKQLKMENNFYKEHK